MFRYGSLIIFAFLIMQFPAQAASSPLTAPPDCQLDVSFDIPHSKVIGTERITAAAGKELWLRTGGLTIIEVRSGSRRLEATAHNGMLVLVVPEDGPLVISFEGVFKGRDAQDANYGVVSSTIDSRGISLTGLWYPVSDEPALYHLRATLPEGFTAISEAEETRKTVIDGETRFEFDFPHPVAGITLVAARDYEEIKSTAGTIALSAYFFSGDRALAETYLSYAKKYLKLYEEMLGPYAYKRFAIVENFLPTGYSMPTYTLLGREVVKLPFIVETSLGHEILHQWFGNLVYVDYEKGNWSEGLTSYLADHLYEEQKGRGWEYRKQTMVDYAYYVNEKNEFPLKDFTGRTDFSSRAIGYGKAIMVFHMLKRAIGDDAFNRSLRELVLERRFVPTSWDDLRTIFEKNSGKDLGWFFKQWVVGSGIPEVSLDAVDIRQNGANYDVTLTVGQKPKAYRLDIPLVVSYLDGSEERFSLSVDAQEKTTVTQSLSGMPEKVVLDSDYDVARLPGAHELPAIVAGIIGAEKPVIVLPATQGDIYDTIIEAFKGKGVLKQPSEVRQDELQSSTLIVLGNDNPVAERLFGGIRTDSGFSVTVKHNPWDNRKVAAVINGKSREEVDAAFRKLFHYGKYSKLLFDNGKNTVKEIEKTQRGLSIDQKDRTVAIDVSAITPLPEILARVSRKSIVYVGEYHDRFSNHAVQLEVIKALYRKNNRIVIGMEMFQRPFQKVLDDYIAGTIDEKAMLKGTEYFSRWSFDYNLYRPILAFAREKKIPVIALNVRREIVDKVAGGGFDALSNDEKKDIPAQMDFSDEEYKERLYGVFQKHAGFKGKNFDFFYESQVLWDETMSQSLDEFLMRNPDFRQKGQVVVLAGSGHLAFGSGVPKRTFRRNGLDYSIILNDLDAEEDIAQYLVYPKAVEGTAAPKIMALLNETQGKVTIEGFPEGSIAEKAGLKAGDTILSFDDVPAHSIDDMKIQLFYKKKGDMLKIKVLRKRFLLGDTEKEFTLTL